MWREGRKGKERSMSATVKQNKNGIEEFTWKPEKGHLAPEVKTANEITCDYV
jgi:hypothetical protein